MTSLLFLQLKKQFDEKLGEGKLIKPPTEVKQEEQLKKPSTKVQELLLQLRARFNNKPINLDVFTNNKLNTNLINWISSNNNVTPIAKEIFDVIGFSYDKNRPKTITVNGIDLEYKPNISSELYAHFENENTIILSIHGASDLKLNKLAITQFLNANQEDQDVVNFCKKIDSITNTEKTIFLVAHSLGGWLIYSCNDIHTNPNVKGIIVGGYMPNANSRQAQNATNPNFKKLFFLNDWLSSKHLDIPNIKNILVFKPKTIFSKLNGHSVANYTGSSDFEIEKQIN